MEVTETLATKTVSPEEVQAYLEAGPAKKLNRERFPSHNWDDHVLPMLPKAEELGKKMGFSEEKIRLLKIIVLLHESGLPEGREGHEERGAEIAGKILKKLGEKEDNITKIKKGIIGTKGEMVDGVYVYEPSDDALVLAMRDLDQSNIGVENFPEISENLRKEQGVEDEIEWIRFEINYLTKLRFQTEEGKELWDPPKKKNLEYLQSKLESL